MVAITPAAMIAFAVFIASTSVHGNSTCKIAPCKCSFSNIEILSKYINERINATVAAIVAEVTATLDALSVTVDDKIATVITIISAVNATVDERISAVNTTVSVHNATVDERIIAMAINTTVSAISSELAIWTPVAKTPIY